MPRRSVRALAPLLVALTACAPAPPVPIEGAAMTAGTAWRVTAIDGQPVRGAPPTLLLGAAEVTGSTGCNRYSGPFRASAGGRVAFGPVSATEMACPGAAMATEAAFLAALVAVDAAISPGGADLVLTDDGRPRLDIAPAGGPVAGDVETLLPSGGSWAITRVGNAPAQGGPTLRREGRQLGGSLGCNMWGGTLVARGTRLDISPITSTLMACLEPGLMDASARVADALGRADGVAGTPGGPLLLTAGGVPVLTLTPVR